MNIDKYLKELSGCSNMTFYKVDDVIVLRMYNNEYYRNIGLVSDYCGIEGLTFLHHIRNVYIPAKMARGGRVMGIASDVNYLSKCLSFIQIVHLYTSVNSKSMMLIESSESPFIKDFLLKALKLREVSSSINIKTNRKLTNYVGHIKSNDIIKDVIDMDKVKDIIKSINQEVNKQLRYTN